MAITIADPSCSPSRQPQPLPADSDPSPRPKQSMWQRLGLRRLLGRDDRHSSRLSTPSHSRSASVASSTPNYGGNGNGSGANSPNSKSHDTLARKLSRRVGVGLPRATTFKRQNCERRDRLEPLEPQPRRAVSADRHRGTASSQQRAMSPQPAAGGARSSAPDVQLREEPEEEKVEEKKPEKKEKKEKKAEEEEEEKKEEEEPQAAPAAASTAEGTMVEEPRETGHNQNHNQIQGDDGSDLRSEWSRPPDPDPDPDIDATDPTEESQIIEMELEQRWILNLTMHFRDRSAREKLFVTYAESPNLWRRVTISCDYRNAEPDSLEQDLRELWNQKDRCVRIYESLRESLPEIQFYDTVTNLKLETRDGRLHVHVTEDVNEIIPYPSTFHVGHLPDVELVPESRLHFVKHESGFVYHVRVDGRSYIKKEIPGPDMVDEFLYEINALHELLGSPNVIQLEGIVVDVRRGLIKGLLIGYADQGALVDVLYDFGGKGDLSWSRRERWARQIVQGLGEIHEAGYVQGDFTLSNIVLDANDNAKIIDINRRGCPVGWEPPEIVAKLESKQRISMYIGVKTDLFQLGMTLWALAMENDEPERECRPLTISPHVDVPDYYRELVSRCLSQYPQERLSAKELLTLFPPHRLQIDPAFSSRGHSPVSSMAVGLRNGPLPLQNVGGYNSPMDFLHSQAGQGDDYDHHRRLSSRQSLDDLYALRRYQSHAMDLPYSYITPQDLGTPGSVHSMDHTRMRHSPAPRFTPERISDIFPPPAEVSSPRHSQPQLQPQQLQPPNRDPDDTAYSATLTSQNHPESDQSPPPSTSTQSSPEPTRAADPDTDLATDPDPHAHARARADAHADDADVSEKQHKPAYYKNIPDPDTASYADWSKQTTTTTTAPRTAERETARANTPPSSYSVSSLRH